MDNTTVKLDKALLKKAKKLLKKTSQRIRYTNLKQFVNIAVLKLLEEEEEKPVTKIKKGKRRQR